MSSLPTISPELASKRERLLEILRRLPHLLVAYSGGVDSAFLAYAAHEVLGEKMLAVIADSASLARSQLEDALAFAREQRIPCAVVNTSELENRDYARNDSDRCFHCKDELFRVMRNYADVHGFEHIAYGVNTDDQGDFRPGRRAAENHAVRAPLLEAGLTKGDIRELARVAGLRVWGKPASACLASRIEYGREVTPEALAQVERGEDILHQLGLRQFRVRHHGAIARIEIARDELPQFLHLATFDEITRRFKALGFTYVTLDLEGFRSGSMNAMLPLNKLVGAR